MGIIFSRWRKKKKAEEILEELQKDIDAIENNLQYATQRQKIIVGKFAVYATITYFLVAVISYFFLPSTVKGRVLICIPLFGLPLLFFYSKQFLSYLYKRDIAKNRDKLADLLTRKKKTLEDVMNTETYKKAKEILDKYAPEQSRKAPVLQPVTPRTPPPQQQQQQMQKVPPTPVNLQRTPQTIPPNQMRRSPSPQQSPMLLQRQQLPRMLVRPIFPQDRGWFDKFIENVVGDGPNNRYALICKNCASHNGMALKEEFEYLAFKCVYCGFPNPSLKVRPRLSLGPATLARRPLFPGGPDATQASIESGNSSDNESGVKIEEVTDDQSGSDTETTKDTKTNDTPQIGEQEENLEAERSEPSRMEEVAEDGSACNAETDTKKMDAPIEAISDK